MSSISLYIKDIRVIQELLEKDPLYELEHQFLKLRGESFPLDQSKIHQSHEKPPRVMAKEVASNRSQIKQLHEPLASYMSIDNSNIELCAMQHLLLRRVVDGGIIKAIARKIHVNLKHCNPTKWVPLLWCWVDVIKPFPFAT